MRRVRGEERGSESKRGTIFRSDSYLELSKLIEAAVFLKFDISSSIFVTFPMRESCERRGGRPTEIITF
jgi:hypothetical protein